MQVERPHSPPLTPTEEEQLQRLRALVENAIADGVITREEAAAIKTEALSTHPSYELLSQELALYRELVTRKVKDGLLAEETLADL